MSLQSLTAADRTIFDALDPESRTIVRKRLAAIAEVEGAKYGTKNAVATRLSKKLNVTTGGVLAFCLCYRKSGIKGILPRKKPAPVHQTSLTR